MRIIKRPAATILKESAHGGSGARKVYASAEHATSPYCEAITHGWLPAGATFDWHDHPGVEETMIVLKGSGEVSDAPTIQATSLSFHPIRSTRSTTQGQTNMR